PDATPQNLANHPRYVPAYHMVAAAILVLNLVWSAIQLLRTPTFGSVVGFLLAIALILLGWYLRAFPLAVQDRVIRLEERIRMERLLPADLKGHIHEFDRDQLIALRFASDQELPALARQVLAENIHDQGAIKRMVKEWRPDHWRA
ncbi:MAG TPA: DUF6526 family protein, partial [Gemmatimonadales bacterium]|nr:DUF6526 family protein [Gemmatimonadales bacterium]